MAELESEDKKDFDAYQMLVVLWTSENPIKTAKLQVLLAVDAILVTAIGLVPSADARMGIEFVGVLLSLVWTFSIARTTLFQQVWELKLKEIRERHPEDVRFSVKDTSTEEKAAEKEHVLLRVFGRVHSKYYLLYSPFVSAFGFGLVLVLSLLGLL